MATNIWSDLDDPGNDVARPAGPVDFGAQYAQLIARRVRECHVFSEIVPYDFRPDDIAARRPAGVILSGGPESAYEPGASALNRDLFDLDAPAGDLLQPERHGPPTCARIRSTARPNVEP